MFFNRDIYEVNPDADYLSPKQQYAKAWHNIRYVENRRNKYSARMREHTYYFLCMEFGISWHVAFKAYCNFKMANWADHANYWQRQRAAIAQSKEQISAYDVMSASYPV